MMHSRKIFVILSVLLAAFFLYGNAAAVVADKTLTVGTVSGDIGATVSVPIKINDASNVGGLAFTLTYFPAALEFKGLEQAGRVITDGSKFPDPGYTTDEVKTDLFYQVNNETTAAGAATGRLMVAAASAEALTGADVVLFNAKFQIKTGTNGTYPINILQTIIQNANAGYNTPTALPVLVGTTTPNAEGMYTSTDFPVYTATLVAGGVTVNAPKFNISGNVTYGQGGSPAAGATVVLRRSTAIGYIKDSETTVSTTGGYSFANKLAGTYRVLVISNDPGYFDTQTDPFTISGNYTVPTIALLEPQRLTGSVTINGGIIPGIKVRVMNGTEVVGVYVVNPDGTFQTGPLSPLNTYTLVAVYGNQQQEITAGQANDWTLALQTIGGNIAGLPASQTVMVMAGSVSGKLQRSKSFTADAEGNFTGYSIENLVQAADYIVSVTGAGLPVTYYDGKTDITQADAVNISSADNTSVNFNFANVTQGYVSGIVTENQSPVGNIGVYAFDTSKFALAQVVTDGTTGAYDFTLSPGTYEIFVIKTNGKIFYYKDGGSTQSEAAATLLTLAAGNTLSDKNIDISECTNDLNGYVTYKRAGGDPAANVLITAASTAGKAIALTGQDGAYGMSGLCPADYRVEMNPLNAKFAIQSAVVAVPPAAGGTATQDFVIDTGNVLSGKVTDSTDGTTAVSGAMIYLVDKETGALLNGRMYFSNATGDYEIADIPTGVYTLNATHPLYRNYSESDLSITTDMAGHDFSMVKGAYFNINVTDGDNGDIPLAGVLIIVTRTGAVPVYAMTNSSGNSKIFGLDVNNHDYIILAQKAGFERPLPKMAQTPSNDGTLVTISIKRPAQLFSLSGEITTDTGAKVTGAYVLVSSTEKKFFASTTTGNTAGNEGKYSFTNLPQASDYRFVVVPGGNLRTYVETNLSFTANSTKDVVLPSGSTITGTVTRTGTAAINVFLYTANNKFVAFTTADANGAYTFSGVTTATTYKVLAVSSGNKPKWFDGVNSIGTATAVSAGDSGVSITLTP